MFNRKNTLAVITDWLTLSRQKVSRRHNDVRALFLPSTGLIENSLFVGVLSHESCHSFIHSLDICGKKLSGGILPWVMTAQIRFLAALSAISFPFIPTWLKIRHRLTCLSVSVSWVTSVTLKYVEDCNIDNIKALNCRYWGKRIKIYHKRFIFQSTNEFESHSSCREFCGIQARFVWKTHAFNLISRNHCTGYGFTSFGTVSVYF